MSAKAVRAWVRTSVAPVSLYGFLTPKPGHADVLRKHLLDLVEPSRGHEGSLQDVEACFGAMISPYPAS